MYFRVNLKMKKNMLLFYMDSMRKKVFLKIPQNSQENNIVDHRATIVDFFKK